MNNATVQRRSPNSSEPGPLPATEEIAAALSHSLDIPLMALRASVETVANGLSEPALLSGVLREVERIEKSVRELMDFSAIPSPMPLRCGPEEIARSALRGLPTSERERIFFACGDEALGFEVDGTLLATCLRRLVENALEAGSERILLAARQEGRNLSFSVIDDAPREFDLDWALEAFHTTKPNKLGLGLYLVRRDVELLGGSLRFRRTPQGDTWAHVVIPDGSDR